MTNQQYAAEKIANEIDGWYSHLDHYLTAWGGQPDREMVDLCNQKIAELNQSLAELYEAA
jgi:hypothetical protein